MLKRLSVITFAMVVAFVLTAGAFAADVQATVTGKVSVQNNAASIQVKEAKDSSGKALADLAGKTLKVVGAKSADAVKLSGKDVEATGIVKNNNTEIDLSAIKECAAAQKK